MVSVKNSSPGTAFLSSVWLPILLAVTTFLLYSPSLWSGFVYDAPIQILQEGYLTSLAHLPEVLTLQVLGMDLHLGTRPGQLLYLMLVAAVWGKEPLGYHLGSNLLHAINVALLFIALRRLIAVELREIPGLKLVKANLAALFASLIFAVHPLAVESVAEVSYSSNLFVVLFTLLALLMAMDFRADGSRRSFLIAGAGIFFCFAAVTCKESGAAAAPLLVAYWFLYRRRDSGIPWLAFLAPALGVTGLFLVARFLLAPPGQDSLPYLGGSFFQVFWLQPQLWVFMMGKLVWPTNLAADYALIDLSGPSPLASIAILAVVVALQIWLAFKSRIGAMGVAFYWLGLATVSNFVPLYRILADRFYYLPLVGVTLQLLALLLLLRPWRWGYRIALAILGVALLPLGGITVMRQAVFANEFDLWNDTVQANPYSTIGHAKLAAELVGKGRLNEALAHYQVALQISPNVAEIHNNLGGLFFQTGHGDEALAQFQRTLELNPNYLIARYNLGIVLLQKNRPDEAADQFQEALRLKPDFTQARESLAKARELAAQKSLSK